jgi:hypothetical protein
MVSDAGLKKLTPLRQLKSLLLRCVTDVGMEHVAQLDGLERLDVQGGDITDACVKHLAELHQLRSFCLVDGKMTEEGAWELKHVLPMCKIWLSGGAVGSKTILIE